MCTNPQSLPDGTLIGCRDCKQCKGRAVLDWSGRCVAESKTAVAASVVTLTYGGGDHARAAVLTYSDVQRFFKLLRKRGYPLKYLSVGEYGDEKGRCHWHVIMYWKDRPYPHMDFFGNPMGDFEDNKALEITLDWDGETRAYKLPKFGGVSRRNPVRYFDDIWPHGHMVWDRPDLSSIRYACKYLLKARKGERGNKQYKLTMSKKPPLGHEYFQGLADRYVADGLAPQDLIYQFDEARDHKGKKLRFKMGGVTASNFLDRYIRRWTEVRPDQMRPWSELVENYIDAKIEGGVLDWDRAALFERLALEGEAKEENITEEEKARRDFAAKHDDYYFGPAKWRFWSGDTEFDDGQETE